MDLHGSDERAMVDVWDWQIRVLHWVNAILIISLALLMFGKEGMELLGAKKSMRAPINTIHAYIGYVFVCTFTLRIIWAFLGNRYARWADIIPFGAEKRKAIAQNIRWYLGGFRGTPARVVGHDPLASLFYIALFIVLACQALSGLTLAGLELHMFPGSAVFGGLAEQAAEAVEEVAEEIHEFGLWFIMFFIAAHLTGLVVHEVKEKTGLFSSMIHGRKYLSKE
jgi:Ni/Fe-hydrogenase b-type cytochrome subunit